MMMRSVGQDIERQAATATATGGEAARRWIAVALKQEYAAILAEPVPPALLGLLAGR